MKISVNKLLAAGLITIAGIAATHQISINTELHSHLTNKITMASESASNIIVDYRHKNIIESINKLEQDNPFVYVSSQLESLQERASKPNYKELLKNSDFYAEESSIIQDMLGDYDKINSNPNITDKDLKPKNLNTSSIKEKRDQIREIVFNSSQPSTAAKI